MKYYRMLWMLCLVLRKILLITYCWVLREGISGLKMAPHTLAERSASITMEGKLSIESSARFLPQTQAEYWQI